MTRHNPWQTRPNKSGLVDIGGRKIFVRITGPVLKPNEPLILIESGGGSFSALWVGVMRHLSHRGHRVLSYDRAGLGLSDPAPEESQAQKRSSLAVAADLETLLQVTGLGGPYIVVAHSFAGVLVRTWMQVYDKFEEVAGCVFLDTATEDLYRRMPIREKDWGFLGEVDVARVLGYDENHKMLTEDEYQEIKKEANEARKELVDVDEAADLLGSLGQYDKTPLGQRPISVIKGNMVEDFRRLTDEAERMNVGTDEQRMNIRKNLPEFDRVSQETETEQLRLSTHGRMVYARKESGHIVIMHQPEFVVAEMEWVKDEYAKLVEESSHSRRR